MLRWTAFGFALLSMVSGDVLPLKTTGAFRRTTVEAELLLISVNDAFDVKPELIGVYLADQIRGIAPADVTVTVHKDRLVSSGSGSGTESKDGPGIDLPAQSRLPLSVVVRGSAGSGYAIQMELENFMSERPVQGLLPEGDPDADVRLYSSPFLASIGAAHGFPHPLVLRLVTVVEVVHSCDVVDCIRGYTCPDGLHLYQLDYECCPRCEHPKEIKFRKAMSGLILDHQAGENTDTITVSVKMQLIPINDANGIEADDIAMHISEQVVGIRSRNVVVSPLKNSSPRAQQRQQIEATITCPAGTGVAVETAIVRYMSTRVTNDGTEENNDESGGDRHRRDEVATTDGSEVVYTAPFLLPGKNNLPYPFVLKLEVVGRTFNWQATHCTNIIDDAAAMVCDSAETSYVGDTECAAACETSKIKSSREALAQFALELAAGRPGPMAAIKAELQLIPINDVTTVYMEQLRQHIIKTSPSWVSGETLSIVSEKYTNVKAHTRLDFTMFVRGPEGAMSGILDYFATFLNEGELLGNNEVSKPFLAELGEPDDLTAPYILRKRSLERIPLAYCLTQTCDPELKCDRADGYVVKYRPDADCCPKCMTLAEAEYSDKYGAYLLDNDEWDKENTDHTAEMEKYKGELVNFNECNRRQ
jgi:hypothetical protein